MKAQKNRQQQNEVYILLWRKKSMPEKSTSHKAKAMYREKADVSMGYCAWKDRVYTKHVIFFININHAIMLGNNHADAF